MPDDKLYELIKKVLDAGDGLIQRAYVHNGIILGKAADTWDAAAKALGGCLYLHRTAEEPAREAGQAGFDEWWRKYKAGGQWTVGEHVDARNAWRAAQPAEELRNKVEGLPRYEHGMGRMSTWMGGDWLKRDDVLALFGDKG